MLKVQIKYLLEDAESKPVYCLNACIVVLMHCQVNEVQLQLLFFFFFLFFNILYQLVISIN